MAAFKKRGYRSCWKKKKKTRNLKQTFRDCLDVMEFNSVSITHNPNIVGPAERTLYGLVIGCCFHHSKLKKFEFGWWKLGTKILYFQSSKLIFSGSLINRVTSWDPRAVHCQIILSPLILPLLSSSFQFISFPKFSATLSHFPLSASSHILASSFLVALENLNRSTEISWDEHSVIEDKIPRSVGIFIGDIELCHY